LINNFSDTNSGFSIQFSGNIFLTDPDTALDCSIIDNFLGPPISACEGDEVVLDATMADAVEYRWLRDDGSGFVEIPGENGATLTTTTSANYEVRVTNLLLNTIISAVQVVFSEIPTTYEMTNAASCTGFDTFNLQQKDAEALGPQDPNNFVVSYYRSLADANSGINVLSKI